MKQALFFFYTVLFLGAGSFCMTNEPLSVYDFERLYETGDSSIIKGSNERIYLNPSRLSYSDEGFIYLQADNSDIFLINNLFVEEGSVYTKITEMKWPFTPFVCSQCKRVNKPINGVCEYCGTPRPD